MQCRGEGLHGFFLTRRRLLEERFDFVECRQRGFKLAGVPMLVGAAEHGVDRGKVSAVLESGMGLQQGAKARFHGRIGCGGWRWRRHLRHRFHVVEPLKRLNESLAAVRELVGIRERRLDGGGVVAVAEIGVIAQKLRAALFEFRLAFLVFDVVRGNGDAKVLGEEGNLFNGEWHG